MSLKPVRFFSLTFVLALILALLIWAWLTLPTLLGRLLPRLPAVAGWSVQAADFSGIGPGWVGLRRLQLHYTGPDGERLGLDLQGLRADYPLFDRHLNQLQVDQLRLSWQGGRRQSGQAWPRLDWSALPWSEVRIDRLSAAIELDPARRWQIHAGLRARQDPAGRIELHARVADEQFQIDFKPGAPARAAVIWRSDAEPDVAGIPSSFYVTYAINRATNTPSKGGAATKPSLQIAGDLTAPAMNRLAAWLRPQTRHRIEQGRLTLDADIRLGSTLGQWEAVMTRIDARALKLRIDQAPTPIRIDLDGGLRLHARPDSSRPDWRVELLPGLQFHAKPLQGQGWAVQTRLAQTLSLASDRSTVSGSLPLNLQLDGWTPLPLTLNSLTLALGTDLALRDLKGHLRLPATALRPGWPATSIAARWRWQGRQLSAQGHVGLGEEKLLSFDIRHTLADACTTAEFKHQGDLARLDRLWVPRPRAWQPLRLQGGRSEGSLSLRACRDANPVLQGALKLHQAALGWDKAQASGLDLELTPQGLNPIAGALEFNLGRLGLAAGVELSAAQLGLGWSGQHLLLRRFEAGLFDGRLSALDQGLELPPAPGRLALDAEGLDLARLLAAIDLKGLSGSGRLSGRLPLAWSKAGVEVRGGRLSATGPGLLRYQPPTQVADNPGLQALRNFHYSRLDLEIDYMAKEGVQNSDHHSDGPNLRRETM